MANILDKLAEEVDKIKEDKDAKGSKKKSGTKISSMEELLDANPIQVPNIGDVLEGKVIEVYSNYILLDLDPLGTGIVLGKEVKDGLGVNKIKKGDKVSATLVDIENEDGYIELSIREASYGKSWDDLESKKDTQDVVATKVSDANRGGLLVELNGINGFLPVSQLSSEHYPRVEDGDKNKILELLKRLVGKEINVKIIDADRDAEKLIVSEKAAMSEKERKVVSQLQIGDVVEGEISGVVDFGAFVKFLPPAKKDSQNETDKLEGLVHISELAWQLIDNPREVAKTGDRVEAQIIGIDDTRISLSMKALKKDPWGEIEKKYKVGDTVEGKVDKINPFGAFVYLDKDIHGLAHVSEFREVYPERKMEEVLTAGEKYEWKILSIEPKGHRMGLMLIKEEKKKKAEKKEKKEDKKEDKKEKKDKKGGKSVKKEAKKEEK
ncbi:MAG: S1 RNA-binding domain-containing protein [Parcubacteria group bacterium]|jgi:small subunit ribosomal protein S1